MFSRKKKKRQHKYINGAKGVISILLCLLLTPFASITLGLVEYHRYQSVIEITDELMELVGISTLTDYDPYIHDRFGLLAVSQQSDLDENASVYAKTAASSMGKQIMLENVDVEGELTLANKEVLRQQLSDFSELSVPSAILIQDFNIEELINALNMVERFKAIIETVKTLADLAEKLTVVVEAGEALQEKLEALQSAISGAKTAGENLVQKVKDLYEKLSNDGHYIPEGATAEQILSTVTAVAENYQQEIQDVVALANTLKSKANDVKTKAQECVSAAQTFAKAVEEAKKVVVTDGGDSKNANVSEDAKETLGGVLEAMEVVVAQTVQQLKQESIDIIKQEIDNFVTGATNSLGIGDLLNRYGAIMDGSYFKPPLSPETQSDLTSLLSLVPAAWSDGEAAQLVDKLREMFVPEITFRPAELIQLLSGALKKAGEALLDNSLEKALELLETLINTLKKLFDLDVFYEADLNAFVSIASGAENNPYQDFLDGIGLLVGAVADFSEAMTDKNIIKKITGVLGAVADLFEGVQKVLEGVIESAGETIKNVGSILGEVGKGKWKDLYQRLLIGGYMRHNLPNRLNSGNVGLAYADRTATGRISLEGSGLTGFSYDKIARPGDILGTLPGSSAGDELTAFEKLAKTLESLRNGAGQDKMFKGAELEYIRAGTNSEIANQIFVFFDIYFLRLLLNAPTVFGDAEVAGLAAAATIASWVVYLIYMLVEPFCDTLLLVNDADVSFVKSKCYLTVGGFAEFTAALAQATMSDALRNEFKDATTEMKDTNAGNQAGGQTTESFTSKLTKVDYEACVLLVLLFNVHPDVMVERLADIIEMETTEYYRQQGKSFSMDKTYTTISVSADVTFNSFFDLGVASGNSPLKIGGKMTRDISY